MNKLFSATEARTDFFHILNHVLYGREIIFIKKAGVDKIVKMEAVKNSHKILAALAGSISNKEAKLIRETIKKSRKYPYRKHPSFD